MIIEKDDSIRLKWLYFILAVVVVFQHAINLKVYTLSFDHGSIVYLFECILERLVWVAVPMYFVASGYMFYRNLEWDNLISKWKRRVFTLVVPYLIWNFVAYLFWCMVTAFPTLSEKMNMTPVKFSLWVFLKDIFLWRESEYLYGPFWFIHSLMLFVLLAPVIHLFRSLLRKIRANVYRGEIIELITYAILIVYFLCESTSFGYYMIGILLAELFKKEIWSLQRNYYKYCWIIGIIWIIFACIPVDHWIMGILTNIVGMSFLWLLIGEKRFTRENRLLIWKSYFWIYCGHYLLLETIEKLWYLMVGDHVWCALIDFLLAPVIVLIILEIAGKLLQKLCPEVWKVAIGQR